MTRLHIRYNRNTFPEDLQLQETANSQFFQGRYVLRHPFKGEMKCAAAKNYQRQTKQRQEQEAQTLAQLTGWNINQIREKINFVEVQPMPWWERLWNW